MLILLDEDDANSCSTSNSSLLEYLEIVDFSLKFVELPASTTLNCGQLESIAVKNYLQHFKHLNI
jgi:hypothetical protein